VNKPRMDIDELSESQSLSGILSGSGSAQRVHDSFVDGVVV